MAQGPWGGLLNQRVFQAKISMSKGTSKFQTGFHLRDVGVNTLSPQDVADEVADFATTSFRTILSDTCRIDGIDVVNLVSKEGGSVSPNNVVGTVATNGGDGPMYVTLPISYRGELRTRYGQGRGLWPMLIEAWITSDSLNATGIAAVQGVIDEMADRFIGPSITTSMHLINLHGLLPPRAATEDSPARPAIEPTWYDVTSIRMNTALSFLRSRKAGVGS